MKLRTDLKPTTDFTRLLNSVTFDQSLTAHEFQQWVRLLALQEGRSSTYIDSVTDLAEKVGVSIETFHKRNQCLRRKGYLQGNRGDILVTVPGEDFVVKEESIAEEEAEKPKRKPTGLSQSDRKTLIKEAWNKYKPEWCAPISGTISPPLYIAIEAQTKHLEHDRDDYDGFMKRICAALEVNEFWSQKAAKPVKAHGIFGWGTPDDKKFRNCQSLYLAANTGKAKAAMWDVNNDQDWIDWFASKGYKGYTRVERMYAPNSFEAFEHHRDNPEEPGTIRLYQTTKGSPVRWTNNHKAALVSAQCPHFA